MGSIRMAEAWFVKIVCTVFVRSSSLDPFLGYFSKHLTPLLVYEVVNKLHIPNLGFKFVEFSRHKLHMNHSYLTYNLILRSLCRSNLHSAAKLVYDWMRCDGQIPDNWLLGFLVSSYAVVGRLDVSKELLADVQCHSNVGVNAAVYNDLFNVLIRQNKVLDAVFLFRELIRLQYKPVTFTVNILMRGLCRAREISEAFKLLEELRSFGCFPDLITYNTLIHGLCRISEVDRARSLLREVCLNGEFGPDVVTYTTIIWGYCKLSMMEEGTLLFDEMFRSGTVPNTFTFNALIDGFGKLGDMASALAMYEKMLVNGCPPDVATFTSLMNGYFRVGKVHQAMDMWHTMNNKNICASLYTYSVLVSGLCNNNRLHEARDILGLLNENYIVPQPFIEIRGWINTGKLSPETLYGAYLVFKPNPAGIYGFDYQSVEVSIGIAGGEASKRTVFLDAERGRRLRYQIVPRQAGIFNHARFLGSVETLSAQHNNNNTTSIDLKYPKERGDGWLEVELGDFFNDGEDDKEVEMGVYEIKSGDWKGGLFLQGIEIRPKTVSH